MKEVQSLLREHAVPKGDFIHEEGPCMEDVDFNRDLLVQLLEDKYQYRGVHGRRSRTAERERPN